MIKSIIFDLDDTLYNYGDLNEQGIKQICKFTCKSLSLKENQFYEAFNKAKKDVKEELGENVASSHNRLLYCQKTLENLYENPFSISLEMYEEYWTYILDNMKLNEGVLQLLEFCKINKTKIFINTGSCFEYGYVENSKIYETTPLIPASLYGSSKVSGVIMSKTFAKINNIPLITLRPFGTYGKYESDYRLLPQLLNAGLKNKPLSLTKGEQIRDYLIVKDVAEAFISTLYFDLPLYEEYNICSSNEITIKKFVEKIATTLKFDMDLFRFGDLKYRENELMYYVGNNSKFMKFSSWKPSAYEDEDIINLFEWYKREKGYIL